MFAQSLRVLDLLEFYCRIYDHKYWYLASCLKCVLVIASQTVSMKMVPLFSVANTVSRIDGSASSETRRHLSNRFNYDPEAFVCLLSTRTGAMDLSFSGADAVIFYDTDWNPVMQQTALKRCHRICQQKEVGIHHTHGRSVV